MIPGHNLQRSFLLFSATLFGLLLWLSISFLVAADRQRQDANHLSHYIDISSELRTASIAVAEERAASTWLTGIDGLFSPANALMRPRARTDESLQQAIASLYRKIEDTQLTSQLRFRASHLEDLIEELQGKINQLEIIRREFAEDLKFPGSLRNRSLHITLFDSYSELINYLELLRHGSTYVSAYTTRDTNNILEVSDAAWNIILSNQLLTAIFEGYITNEKTTLADAEMVAATTLQSIEQSIRLISRIDAYTHVDDELHTHASQLEQWYFNEYLIPVRKLTRAIGNRFESPYTNQEWKRASITLADRTQLLLDRAVTLVQDNLAKTEQRAIRNLSIDTALVAGCLFLMLCAYWIVRRMHYQATHDELTGLANRRLFNTKCDHTLDSVTSTGKSLLKIDLHKFKAINDSFGQVVGDRLLQKVAMRLAQFIGTSALTARLGGDEYAVLLTRKDAKQTAALAKELTSNLAGLYHIDGHSIDLNLCIGFACHPEHATSSEALQKAADLALYEAKRNGPGTTLPYRTEIAKAFQERQQLEQELAHALERGEFELHYQPQFDLEHSVVEGVEALIRWHHPKRGLVSPFHFIPIAEDAGMLPAIGQWIINEAVSQAARWRDEFGLHLRMSVNVSTHQFFHGDLVESIATALERENVPPSAFEIEITESVAMAELDLVIHKLNALRDLGIRIALDDFGTGYSSLSHLQDLPLDTLKIDRSFVTKVDQSGNTQRLLLESIAGMAKLLGFHTVAEGVENDQQLDTVRMLGIDTVQGYYYSRPVSGDCIPADVQKIDAAHGGNLKNVA